MQDLILPENELQDLLKNDPNSIIWSQKVFSSKKWRVGVIYKLSFIALIVFVLSYFTEITFDDIFNFKNYELKEMVINTIILVSWGIFFYSNSFIASTMKYAIQPQHISFSWGLFKRKKVDIPFSDILTIDLVEYNDSDLSTIYFGTSKTYDVKKMDFDNNDSRAQITFERVKNGQKVYALLKDLKNASE